MTADLFYEIVGSLWQYACIDADTHQMKEKSKFPLHTAIEHGREDVVFLFLIEYDTQLKSKVNEVDDKGHLPIELALHLGHESIANTLVKSTLTSFQVDLLVPNRFSMQQTSTLWCMAAPCSSISSKTTT